MLFLHQGYPPGSLGLQRPRTHIRKQAVEQTRQAHHKGRVSLFFLPRRSEHLLRRLSSVAARNRPIRRAEGAAWSPGNRPGHRLIRRTTRAASPSFPQSLPSEHLLRRLSSVAARNRPIRRDEEATWSPGNRPGHRLIRRTTRAASPSFPQNLPSEHLLRRLSLSVARNRPFRRTTRAASPFFPQPLPSEHLLRRLSPVAARNRPIRRAEGAAWSPGNRPGNRLIWRTTRAASPFFPYPAAASISYVASCRWQRGTGPSGEPKRLRGPQGTDRGTDSSGAPQGPHLPIPQPCRSGHLLRRL